MSLQYSDRGDDKHDMLHAPPPQKKSLKVYDLMGIPDLCAYY